MIRKKILWGVSITVLACALSLGSTSAVALSDNSTGTQTQQDKSIPMRNPNAAVTQARARQQSAIEHSRRVEEEAHYSEEQPARSSVPPAPKVEPARASTGKVILPTGKAKTIEEARAGVR
ncbi:MAG: hypothetical protein LBH38_04110, partial [Holosporales bacterium]|nr:hypothetical protein [Holosporales bacterium]